MKKRVLVAMSGGVDSSIASFIMHERGYEVIGITMKTWDYNNLLGNKKSIGCCSLNDINDARNISVKLGFSHIVLDIRKDFENYIIDYFIKEYLSGRTPNPCILCNVYIKWNILLEKANILNCSFIVTGHYANITKINKRFVISKSKDKKKDQSYALWGISQDNLKKTIFPLGNLMKKEVKFFAKKKNLNILLEKSESYEICFIPNNNYRLFLKNKLVGSNYTINSGEFVLRDGTILGYHQGYPFYTIGQRKGINIFLGYPVYVVDLEKKYNRVILGSFIELSKIGIYVNNINIVKYFCLNKKKMNVITKINYNDIGTPSILEKLDDNKIKITFSKKIYGSTPGQSAVFYEHDDLIGGGFILSTF